MSEWRSGTPRNATNGAWVGRSRDDGLYIISWNWREGCWTGIGVKGPERVLGHAFFQRQEMEGFIVAHCPIPDAGPTINLVIDH